MGPFHWPTGLLSYKVETVSDLCFIVLAFSRQLETFSIQHVRALNWLETIFFKTKVSFSQQFFLFASRLKFQSNRFFK